MAIYGDGKHNEDMEHIPSKFEITDQTSYVTAHFTVESEDGKVYNLSLQESDWFDHWQVMDEDGAEIEDEVLRNELIDLCNEQLEKGNDESE